MSRPAVTLPLAATAGDAADTMARHGFRHLPVVAPDDRLVGLVAASDLFTAAQRDPDWRAASIEALMATEVVTLTPEMSLHAAARLLSRRGHGGGPVLDPHHHPIGYLSARDLLAVLITRIPLTLWV
ncbi:MAG: CBS domain-containing protein [Myxococcales bacterium]|nr:CBS domain-containing protein [Myxococcales bacterium]